MLTADHLRARVKNGVIQPIFVDATKADLVERAEGLRATLLEHVGEARRELDEVLQGFAGEGRDAKLWAGVVKVALDKSEFKVEAGMAPADARRVLFAAAQVMGPIGAVAVPGGRPTVEEVYEAVSKETGVAAEVLAAALYADHPDELVLTAVDVPSGSWLLHRYNVALVQALLLHAEEVRIALSRPKPGKSRQLLRAVKFHQLIHHARSMPEGYALTLDGPLSLFSQGSRYGLSLARFFPALLLQTEPWTLEAPVRYRNASLTLKLSSADGLRSHYRDIGAYDTREATWFAERFTALGSGWTLRRDAEPISQGGEGVVVPDFTFEKDGRLAHLEILGFWRKGTVEKRLSLLSRHGPDNLILAVSKRLCGGEGEELPAAVVPFAEVIPAKEVLRRVEAIAR